MVWRPAKSVVFAGVPLLGSIMEPIKVIRSRTAVLPNSNIDTDQIIPARFLTTTTREGLGKHLFNEWRYDAAGALRPDFALNKPDAQGCQVLVGGRNLGCGSSREHAPWALLDYGFRAVISTEIADIFRNNSLKNGLVPVVVDEDTGRWLIEHPGAEVEIDIATATLALPTGAKVSFPIEGFARYCLLNGVDELGFLLDRMPQIQAYERAHNLARS
jgi:3-isopropylmalate/(R)-2-methylmalate dehydratase small subunit